MKTFCNEIEKIENYELAKKDNFRGWVIHHRLESHFSDGTERPKNCFLSPRELKALDVYYNRPPEELIFLTRSEHARLHMLAQRTVQPASKNFKHCKPHSEETKAKIREKRKYQVKSEKQIINWTNMIRELKAELSIKYKEYKKNGGLLSWNMFQQKYKELM